MTDLTIEDETFRVETDGDPAKPAVVLSNSLGTDLALWDAHVPALAQHFHVIRYDARGHGGSVVGATPYSLAKLGRDVLAILDALEIGRAHFVGISMGGAVGQWLLLNAPERIERAVLAATAARFGTPEGWNARITSVLADGMERNADATMTRWLPAAFASDHPERVAPIDAALRATSPEGYAACCAALRDMDLRAALPRIANPVLVVTGADDPVISDADTALLTQGIAGAEHLALEGMHLVNVTAGEAFDAAVVRFLTAKAARRPARKPAGESRARGGAPVPAVRARRSGARAIASARQPVEQPALKGRRKPAAATSDSARAKTAPKKAEPKKAEPKNAEPKTSALTKPMPGKTAARGKTAKEPAPAKSASRTVAAGAKTPAKPSARAAAIKPARSKFAAAIKAAAARRAAAKKGAGAPAKPAIKRAAPTKAPAARLSARANAAPRSGMTPDDKGGVASRVTAKTVPGKTALATARPTKTAPKKAAAKRATAAPAPARTPAAKPTTKETTKALTKAVNKPVTKPVTKPARPRSSER